MKHKIHTATAAALACGASRWTRSRSRRIAGEIRRVPAGTVLHRFTYEDIPQQQGDSGQLS